MAGRDRMTIEEVVRQVLRDEHGDVIRESVRAVAQELMQAEVSELIGAEHGERTEDRATHRNGYRPRRWDTRAGEIELQIPKLRQGSYFPSFLQPRKRSEQALVSVVQQAYVCGVSTRRVDQLVESLGLRISQVRGEPDRRAARRAGAGVSRAAVGGPLPLSVRRREDREGPRRRPRAAQGRRGRARRSRDRARARSSAWTSAKRRPRRSGREFLRQLVARGLVGVQLAISDAHPGLKAALATVLGAPWQRCTVHFLRDLRGHARKDQHDALGAVIRQIFTASNGEEARSRLGDAVAQLEPRLPKIAALLEEAEDDVLAFYAFPAEHWPKLRSTNPLERFNREIARRTDVVGIFPDDASVIRLVSMLAIEANDEWLVGRSYISRGSMTTLYETRSALAPKTEEEKEVSELIAA